MPTADIDSPLAISFIILEKAILESQLHEFPQHKDDMPPDLIEGILAGEEKKGPTRIAYYRSLRMVERIIEVYGEPMLMQSLLLLAEGRTLDDAFQVAFGTSLDDVVATASDYTIDI